jgi:hypothetical protein
MRKFRQGLADDEQTLLATPAHKARNTHMQANRAPSELFLGEQGTRACREEEMTRPLGHRFDNPVPINHAKHQWNRSA